VQSIEKEEFYGENLPRRRRGEIFHLLGRIYCSLKKGDRKKKPQLLCPGDGKEEWGVEPKGLTTEDRGLYFILNSIKLMLKPSHFLRLQLPMRVFVTEGSI